MKYLPFFLIVLFIACGKTSKDNTSQGIPEEVEAESFKGNSDALEMADAMFSGIGGMDKWKSTRSLYIKAIHTEKGIDNPYTSQIWRALDEFKLRIEQGNDEFHVMGEISDAGGKITYLDDRDTSRVLSDEQLEGWRFSNAHNIYVILHRLAKNPEQYIAGKDDTGRLTFHADSVLYVAFKLDSLNRPYQFFAPNREGELRGSIFEKWSEDDGLIHSAGGHPMDSSFFYNTEVWEPSEKGFDEVYEF